MLGPQGAGRPVDRFLLGANAVNGPVVNLTYNDPVLVATAAALNVGALRYPGGTVANYWNYSAGAWVEPCRANTSSGHYDHCANLVLVLEGSKTFRMANLLQSGYVYPLVQVPEEECLYESGHQWCAVDFRSPNLEHRKLL